MSLYLGSGNKVVKRTRLKDHVVTTVHYAKSDPPHFQTWVLLPGEEDDDPVGELAYNRSRALAQHAQAVRNIRHMRSDSFRSDHFPRLR